MANTKTATLRDLIIRAKHAYYRGEAILNDDEYDAIEDELRFLSPGDPVLTMVGSVISSDSMLMPASHTMPMGSQNKVNSEDEIRAWFAKNEVCAVHASLKGDGGSAAAYFEDGRFIQAIGRGDGKTGEDITANVARFRGMPSWAGGTSSGFTGSVRFEAILTVADWAIIDPLQAKNPRNAGNGIMRRKNGNQSDFLTAFAFDIIELVDGKPVVFKTESEKTERLKALGFNVMPHLLCESVEDAISYFKIIVQTRDSLPFWIDGVVVKIDDVAKQEAMGESGGCPKGQIAWKFDSSGMETVLEGVVITGGHTGALIPTGFFRPVEIGGTTVSNALLANFDEIARLDVAIGDSIWVVKANDIIPKIIRVTNRPANRVKIVTPCVCPFCGGEVGRRQKSGGEEGVVTECRNPACSKKTIGRVSRWISSLDILGIGDVALEAMMDRMGVEDPGDLYLLRDRLDELAAMTTNTEKGLTLGTKRATSILEAIDAKRNLTLSQFLGSLGVDHLGKRRVEIMIKAAGGALDTLADWRSGALRDPDLAAKAGAPSIAKQIQDGIDGQAHVIDKLLSAGVTILAVEEVAPLADGEVLKTVCISGKLPSGKKKSDYEAPLKAAGFSLVDEVAKGLTYLVLADPASTSSKSQKAQKLGVAVISEEQLQNLIYANADCFGLTSSLT